MGSETSQAPLAGVRVYSCGWFCYANIVDTDSCVCKNVCHSLPEFEVLYFWGGEVDDVIVMLFVVLLESMTETCKKISAHVNEGASVIESAYERF